MNFNVSPIAFYPSRAAQPWRAWYYQRKIAVVTGDSLLPFLINDTPATAPDTVEIYEPNTDTLVSTRTGVSDILAHVSTVAGQSVTSWIYQGTSAGIFGFTTAGYYYLKIGNYYSDIIKFGAVEGDFVQLEWQTFDDIITVDGTLLSKYIKHKLIFETDLWHPTYEVKEEGKENNGIYYQTSRTLTKTSGFSAIVNEAVLDSLYSIGNGDKVTIEARRNGVLFSYETNRVEVKNTVQSDDVESVQVEFDLFSIIRKYQKSENAPEPLPIPTPPEPPTVYKIRGTAVSGATTVTLKINNTPSPVNVVSGRWVYGYDTPINGSFECSDNNVATIDFTESCLLKQVTTFYINSASVTDIDFGLTTLESLTHTYRMFYGAKSLKAVNIPYANINTTQTGGTESDCSMFNGCESLKTINIPNSDLSKQLGGTYKNFFYGCKSLESVSIPATVFDNGSDFENFFYNAKVDGSFTFGSATLSNCTNAKQMFYGSIGNIDLDAIFPSVSGFAPTSVEKICFDAKGATIDLTGLDFSNITSMRQAFYRAVNMENLTLDTSTLSGVTNWSQAFAWCKNYTGAATTFATFTFTNATNISSMFLQGLKNSFELPVATFASATDANAMFTSSGCTSISLPAATFESLVGDNAADLFRENASLVSVSMPQATFAAMDKNIQWGLDCDAWATFAGSGAEAIAKNLIVYSKALTFAAIQDFIGLLDTFAGGTGFLGIYTSVWNTLDGTQQTAINTALAAKSRQIYLM